MAVAGTGVDTVAAAVISAAAEVISAAATEEVDMEVEDMEDMEEGTMAFADLSN